MRLSNRSLSALVAMVLVGAAFTVRGFLSSQQCLASEKPVVEMEEDDGFERPEPLRGCRAANLG